MRNDGCLFPRGRRAVCLSRWRRSRPPRILSRDEQAGSSNRASRCSSRPVGKGRRSWTSWLLRSKDVEERCIAQQDETVMVFSPPDASRCAPKIALKPQLGSSGAADLQRRRCITSLLYRTAATAAMPSPDVRLDRTAGLDPCRYMAALYNRRPSINLNQAADDRIKLSMHPCTLLQSSSSVDAMYACPLMVQRLPRQTPPPPLSAAP